MADSNLPDLTELNATPADADELYIVDKSDTTDGVSGTNKKITRSNLIGGLQAELSEGAFADGDKTNYDTRVVTIIPFLDSEDTATGDGAGDVFWRVPSIMNGYNLVEVAAQVQTAGTTGTTDIQIHNVTQAVDMLTTVITIDSGETDSSTAATAAVIDTANDDVATGDQIRIDVDAVSTTAAVGLLVELQFRKA